MLTDKPIIIIQNTNYHFETALSIYQSLRSLNLNVYVYRCEKDKFSQDKFLQQQNVSVADQSILETACCGFVVSAYPNPNVDKNNSIPNYGDKVFDLLKNKLIFISHRFKNESDYTNNKFYINKKNSICLSPLSQNIGLDYFNPIEMPIEPKFVKINGLLKLSTQSHFELNNRDDTLVDNLLKIIRNKKNKIIKLNFLGTKAREHYAGLNFHQYKFINYYENLKENYFYKFLNNLTNFLVLGIDDKIKNGTYSNERYSSNFNQAFALNKPIFCHEFFKDIYKVPGIYYNENNFYQKAQELLNIKEDRYLEIVKSFVDVKKTHKEHNDKILTKKISYILRYNEKLV